MQDSERYYSSFAMSGQGATEIDRYHTAQDAIEDTLDMWPEENEGDVVIEDHKGKTVAYFARSPGDPLLVHVYHLETEPGVVAHVESYRCEYEVGMGGALRTRIRRIG